MNEKNKMSRVILVFSCEKIMISLKILRTFPRIQCKKEAN